MKSTICIIFLSFLSLGSFAQNGHVEIIKDPKLDLMVKKVGTPIPPATSPQIPGYRIQLFFDSERKKVDEARSKFISLNPKIDTYIVYNAPNYILKAGDFRTQNEVDKLKDGLMSNFPTCFVVKEMINLPRIDQ